MAVAVAVGCVAWAWTVLVRRFLRWQALPWQQTPKGWVKVTPETTRPGRGSE